MEAIKLKLKRPGALVVSTIPSLIQSRNNFDKKKIMSHDLNHLCLESNPKFDNVSDDLKVYSDVFEDVPYTMYGRCRRFSKLLVGPKIYVKLIEYIPRYSYTMHGNCRTGSKLSDDLQSTQNSEDGFDVVRIYSEMSGKLYTDGCCRCIPTLSEDSA